MQKDDDKYNSISAVHRLFGLPNPVHPLITLINNTSHCVNTAEMPTNHVLHFYKIAYSKKLTGKLKYGQGYYDFDDGGLLFAAPNQVIGGYDDNGEYDGYVLLIHPDFLLGYPLAKKIKQYGFFSYSANEALHLSGREKEAIVSIYNIMEDELNSRIDEFSQDVMIAQIELLLSYANRFYKRQFITRKAASSQLLQKLEEVLEDYFNNQRSLNQGIPTVNYLAGQLNISATYLSDMLRSLTGQNAQQHIHNKLIEKAKEQLSATSLSISEVAYMLGFEHPQSFSKLFKVKTNLSPLEFRKSFN